MKHVGRTILSILGGAGATLLLFLGIGLAVEQLTNVAVVPWHTPQRYTPVSLTVTAGRLVASVVAGAFVAAWLSRDRVMWRAVAFGVLILLLALFDGAPPESIQPRWFTVLVLVMLVPASMCGGMVAQLLRRHGALSHEGG